MEHLIFSFFIPDILLNRFFRSIRYLQEITRNFNAKIEVMFEIIKCLRFYLFQYGKRLNKF